MFLALVFRFWLLCNMFGSDFKALVMGAEVFVTFVTWLICCCGNSAVKVAKVFLGTVDVLFLFFWL